MKAYRQGAFRNPFEERLFETVQDALVWCANYAAKESFPYPVNGEVYHNVQTAEFHGELSTTDTFADPQSREIDILVELELPRQLTPYERQGLGPQADTGTRWRLRRSAGVLALKRP